MDYDHSLLYLVILVSVSPTLEWLDFTAGEVLAGRPLDLIPWLGSQKNSCETTPFLFFPTVATKLSLLCLCLSGIYSDIPEPRTQTSNL